MVSQEYNKNCCWTLEKFSFLYTHFAIIDTADYLADPLFIKHEVRVHFGGEFVNRDEPYRIILCKCRKRDVARFLAAVSELPNKMLLRGHTDYLTFCEKLNIKIGAALIEGGAKANADIRTAQEAEQESAKGTSCQEARDMVRAIACNAHGAEREGI